MITDTATIVRTDGVLSRELSGEAVLLDTNGGAYFGLNAVATRAWDLIGTAGITKSALVDVLLTEFDVERSVLVEDLDSLLSALLTRKLIQVRLSG